MPTFVMRNGRLVSKHKAAPLHRGIISDDMGADLEHHGYADGRKTASKSQFRRWTKDAQLVEKGNDRDRPVVQRDPDLRGDVIQAIQMVRDGYRPQYRRGQYNGEGWQ